jgi:hypothetical protein
MSSLCTCIFNAKYLSWLFRLWKTADSITLRLPPPVRRALRKSRLLNTVRGR